MPRSPALESADILPLTTISRGQHVDNYFIFNFERRFAILEELNNNGTPLVKRRPKTLTFDPNWFLVKNGD